MIAWSIEAALQSKCFDRVIVSTDDEEIAAISISYGAEIPFMRPKELADDYAATRPVVNHAIESIVSPNCIPEYVCCIYPAAPFIKVEDLRESYTRLVSSKLDYIFTASAYPYPIQRSFRIRTNKVLERINSYHKLTRSQDLEEMYHDAGQFYWGRKEAFISGSDMISAMSMAYLLPSYRVQDIDTMEDWRKAEIMALVIPNFENNIDNI